MKTLLSILLFTIILWMVPGTVTAKKLAELPEVFKGYQIAMDNENLYVSEKADIFVYSRKDYKLKHKFGKKGEGPQEIMPVQHLGVMLFPQKDNRLYVNATGKTLIFTKDGKFLKEISTKVNFGNLPLYQPIGPNFAGLGMAFDAKERKAFITFNIYDEKMKSIKELGRQPFNVIKISFPLDLPSIAVSDNKIVHPVAGGFRLNVYDAHGKLLTTIKRDEKKLKVTDAYKKGLHTFMKRTLGGQYEAVKQRLSFKEYSPPIQYFYVDNSKIYIMTFVYEKGKAEFFVYSLTGKFIKRTMIPFTFIDGFQPGPAAVKNNTLYQLVENEETETIELHSHRF